MASWRSTTTQEGRHVRPSSMPLSGSSHALVVGAIYCLAFCTGGALPTSALAFTTAGSSLAGSATTRGGCSSRTTAKKAGLSFSLHQTTALLYLSNRSSSSSTTAVAVSTTAAGTNDGEDTDDGVADFETWFAATKGARKDDRIRHGRIGKLRGLIWQENNTAGAAPADDRRMVVATVPRSIVLSTAYSKDNKNDDDWDARLAVQLWKAILTGGNSSSSSSSNAVPLSGYGQLLLQGSSPAAPASTAPHALRRWSAQQRDRLSQTARGQRVLQLEADQTTAWRKKYNQTVMMMMSGNDDDDAAMTWDQFQWALEAVHSRAFCGVQTTSSSLLPSLAAPVLAATAILGAYLTLGVSSDETLSVVAVAATALSIIIPTLLPQQQQQLSAVMLPLIDSANHLDGADSSIAFNPLTGSFELSIGSNCLVREKDEKEDTPVPVVQLYISYGIKSMEELLLNHGFLPGVPMSAMPPPNNENERVPADTSSSSRSSSTDDDDDDEYRSRLAARYQQ